MPTVERMSRAMLVPMLPALLRVSAAESRPSADQAKAYQAHLDATRLAWQGWYCGPQAQPDAVALAVFPPDRTALLMTGIPGEDGVDPVVQQFLTIEATETLRRQRLLYAQAIIDPSDAGRRSMLLSADFRDLTGLIYLDRSARAADDQPDASAGTWVTYAPSRHAAFAALLERTYIDSADCPELMGRRSVEAIMAAHRAAGPFDPDLWLALERGGALAGCILLARIAESAILEIVYVGVAPEHRRSGVGEALVRRSLRAACDVAARSVLVVVDDRNTAARRLYRKLGFRQLLRRRVLLRLLSC